MLKKELLEIIANSESSTVEFKRDDVKPEQLAKEIVAFANSYGGRLFLGIEDNGSISGIKRADLEHWIMDTVCAHYVYPPIIPQYEEVQIEEGLRVAVITVPAGVSKPYVMKHKGKEKFFIRAGSTSRIAYREQIIRMSALGGMLHVETLPVPRTSLKSLDKARLENYFKDILTEPSLPRNDKEWKQRLGDMGFMAEYPEQDKVCTIAGLLLFGINPRRYLKQAGLRVMVFDSHDKEYKALLDIVLDAPMVARVEVIEQRVSEVIDYGLVEKVAAALYPFITEESGTINKDFRRPLKRYYPWNAVRELILNALAHRDWTRTVDIEICRYNDRLEIISPGALPNTMTIEKMIGGRRTPRNTIIMEVLKDYQYVDSRGMGIRTKVIPIMKEFNGTKPEFESTEDYLKVTLRNNGPKNDPLEAKNDPLEAKDGPLEVENEPLEVENGPLEVENGPLEVENEPLDVKNGPLEIESDPLEVKDDLKRRDNDPNINLNDLKYDPDDLNIDLIKMKNDLDKPKDDPNDGTGDFESSQKKIINDLKDGPIKDVLILISKKPSISYTELADIIDKSPSTVKRYIQELKRKGFIYRKGPRRGGKWVIK